jgi:ribonuclease HIII
LAALEKHYGLKLPKGGGGQVDEAAREFVLKHGRENLSRVVKLHFRNTLRLPGPLETQGSGA